MVYAKTTVGRRVSAALEGVDEQPEVVAAEIANGRGEVVDRDALHQLPQPWAGGVADQPAGHVRPIGPQHALVLLVGHLLEPAAQLAAARRGEQFADPPAPFQGDHLPAGRAEHALQAFDLDVRHHPVQGLPVQVDHPQQLAELGDRRVGDGLPDGALVELRIAEQADESSGGRRVDELRADVAVRERGPQRRGGADSDRAGGEVDGVRVFDPARVALQAALLPQRRQVVDVQIAEQVVDRVQDGGGVRLDRDPVQVGQLVEPQGDHDLDDRRR